MNLVQDIHNDENIVRILHRDWVVDGMIQLGAFTLRPKETYISVNRPAVFSYPEDVATFVESHSAYQHTGSTYQFAMLNVGDVRRIRLEHDDKPINIDVEVEPRSSRIASHAGIFTRVGSMNIKKGNSIPIEPLPLGISADDVLMEVGWSLIDISTLREDCFKTE